MPEATGENWNKEKTMLRRLEHAIMTMEKPSPFFDTLSNEERAVFREVYDLIGVMQPEKYHPEGDAFVHTMMVLDEAAQVKEQAIRPFDFMLAALTHDLGKKIATGRKENGEWHSIGHERKGIPLIRAMLTRLGAKKETICYCENLCKLHMRVHTCFYGKAGVKATNRLFGECVCPQDLALLCICDTLGTGKPRESAVPEERFIRERLNEFIQQNHA